MANFTLYCVFVDYANHIGMNIFARHIRIGP